MPFRRRRRRANDPTGSLVGWRRIARRAARLETLEQRRLLAGDWQNSINPLDVNDDGIVTPVDVLSTFNQQNSRTVIDPQGSLPDRAGFPDFPFWDTTGDGLLAPVDSLRVINGINGDVTPPTVVAQLKRDTGPFGQIDQNKVTADAAIEGSVTDLVTGTRLLTASVDGGEAISVVVARDGTFQFDPGLASDGSDDGQHTVEFTAEDARGNQQSHPFTFSLDTTAPIVTVESPLAGASVPFDFSLSGTLSDATSQVSSVAYAIDNGLATTTTTSTDTFSIPVPLRGQSEGPHTVTVIARDQAGNIGQGTVQVDLSLPFIVSGYSPRNGAVDVGVTVRPKIEFSTPIDVSTLDASNFFAEAAGRRLAARIVPADTGAFAWLYLDEAMPGATLIRVTVIGDTIRTADGSRVLDADRDGVAGGVFQSTFTTVSRTALPGTSLSGRVVGPGPDGRPHTLDDSDPGPDGQLGTNDDIFLFPIADARVFLLGMEHNEIRTAPDGTFQFDMVPAGAVKLAIDGTTSDDAPEGFYYPEMVLHVPIHLGQDNHAMPGMPAVYLPPLRESILQQVSGDDPTMIVLSADAAGELTDEQRQLLTVNVPANSLVSPDGLKQPSGEVGISTVAPELVRDMLPPGVLQHTFDITIQAPGTEVFSTPAPMTFPNVFGLPPGTKQNFLSFDHNTGLLVIEGTATVSEDGQSVHTDPGTGITHPGWHGLTDEGGPGCGEEPPPEEEEEDEDEEPPFEPTESSSTSFYTGVVAQGGSSGGSASDKSGASIPSRPSGEEGEIFRFVWDPFEKLEEEPPEDPDPPGGSCPLPPPGDDDDDGPDQRKIEVEITVLGEPDKWMMPLDESKPIATDKFTIDGSNQDPVILSARLKRLDEMAGTLKGTAAAPLKGMEEDLLLGVFLEIKVTRFDHDGEMVDQVTGQQRLYRFIDGTDSTTVEGGRVLPDGVLGFPRTRVGQPRTKTLKIEVPGVMRPNITAHGTTNANDFQYAGGTLTFNPSDKGAEVFFEGGEMMIESPPGPGGETSSLTVPLSGVSVANVRTWHLDQATFMTAVEHEVTSNPIGLDFLRVSLTDRSFDAAKGAQFFQSVISKVDQYFSPFSGAVAHSGQAHVQVSSNRTFPPLDLTLGDSNGIAINRNLWPFVVRDRDNFSQSQLGHRMAKSFLPAQGRIDLNVGLHLNAKRAQLAGGDDSAGFIAATIAHELGHRFGLFHTAVFHTGQGFDLFNIDPLGDLMAQGFLGNDRTFNMTRDALWMSLGLPWDPSSGIVQGAVDFYARPGTGSYQSLDDGIDPNVEPGVPLESGLLTIWDVRDGSNVQEVDFGVHLVGGDAVVREFAMQNVGDRDVALDTLELANQTAGFSLTVDSLPDQLAPGELVEFAVTYSPGEPGQGATELQIRSDAFAPAIDIGLLGRTLANAPMIDMDLTDNQFGPANIAGPPADNDQLLTITNVGAAPLEISSIRLVDASSQFTLLNIPADLANSPLVLATDESFRFGARFAPEQTGLRRAKIVVDSNDPAAPMTQFHIAGSGDGPARVDRGDNYVAVATPNLPGSPVLRGRTDERGFFEFFLPPEERYTLVIFDPESGLVAHDAGRTSPSGQTTVLAESANFRASREADRDGDGLPADVEFAIGSSDNQPDTDQDGLDDFAEIERGLDPVGDRVPLGIVANLPISGEARAIVVAGASQDNMTRTAWIASGTHGLAIVDATRLTSPILLSEIDLAGDNRDLAHDPNRQLVAVAAGTAGLHLVDVSRPSQPELLRTVSLPAGAHAVELFGGMAYVASGAQLASVDLASGEVVELLDLNPITTLARENGTLYVLEQGLRIVDISGFQMQARGRVVFPSQGNGLFVGNNIAYVTDDQIGGYATFDVSDPDNPTLISESDVPVGVRSLSGKLVANGSGLGLLIGTNFTDHAVDVMATGDPNNTYQFVSRHFLPAHPADATVAAGVAYVAGSQAGLLVVNYTDFDVDGVPPQASMAVVSQDQDPAIPGHQAFETSTVSIRADVVDDVQVASLQLLVDGVVVQTDVSFPWDFSFDLPKLADQASVDIRVRATDTGGNSAISASETILIIADTTPPSVIATNPTEGSRRTSTRLVRIGFSEALDSELIALDGLELTHLGADGLPGGGDDSSVLLESAKTLDTRTTLAVLARDSLAVGVYELVVGPEIIADRAGNPMQAPFTLQFEIVPGEASLDQVIAGQITVAGQEDRYQVDAEFGQRVFFDSLDQTNDNLRVDLISPSGALVLDQSAFFDSNQPITLIETGSYELRIHGPFGATGDYRFRVMNLNRSADVGVSELVSGTFASNDEVVALGVDAEAGRRLLAQFGAMNPFDVTIRMFGLANQRIDLQDRLPVDGRYHVLLDSNRQDAPPSYDLRFVQPRDSTLPLTFGTTVTGSLAVAGEQDHFEFNGLRGQRIFFDGIAGNAVVSLFNPSGGQPALFASGSPAHLDIGPVILPENGTYRLQLEAANGQTGNYAFRVLDRATSPAVPLDVEVNAMLDAGAHAHLYQITASANDMLFFDNTTLPANVNRGRWKLFGPGSQVVAPLSGFNFFDATVTIPADGEYTLAVYGQDVLGGGFPYSFRLLKPSVNTSSLTVGDTVESQLNGPGDLDRYTLQGTSGQQLYFDGLGGAFQIQRRLIDPRGEALFESSSPQDNFGPFTLHDDGEYRLEIAAQFGDLVGDYAFRVLDPANAAPVTVGQAQQVTLSQGADTGLFRFDANQGQRLVFTASNLSRPVNSGERVSITDPDGNHLGDAQLGVDLEVLIPEDGSYLLAIAPARPNLPLTFDYTLSVDVRPPVVPDGFGQTFSGTIDPNQQDTITFQAATGTRVYFDLLQGNSGNLFSILQGPSGFSDSISLGAFTSDQGPLFLPQQGEYTLQIPFSAGPNATGSYAFRLLDFAPSNTIAVDQTLEETLGASSSTFHAFSGPPGARVYFDTNGTFDYRTELIGGGQGAEGSQPADDALITLNAATYEVLLQNQRDEPTAARLRPILVDQAPLLTFASPVVDQLNPAGSARVYRFDGTAGQRFAFDGRASSSFSARATLFSPARESLFSTSLTSDTAVLLPATGSYTLIVDAPADAVVDFEFVANLDDQTRSPINRGDLVEGSTTQPFEQRLFGLNAVAGDRIYLDTIELNHQLRIAPPSGGSGSGQSIGFRPLTLHETGEYVISVQEGSGDFKFRLVDPDAAPVAVKNTPNVVDLDPQTEAAVFRLETVAGERMFFDFLSGNFRLEVFDPADRQVANQGFDFELVAPVDGEYLLVVSSSSSPQISFQVVTPETTVEPLLLNQQVAGSLDTPGELDVFTFSAAAGQRLAFDSLDNFNNPRLGVSLVGPSQVELFATRNTTRLDEREPITLTEAGQYTLTIGGSDTVGNYGIQLLSDEVNSVLPLDQQTSGLLNPGFANQLFSIDAEGGQRLFFDARSSTSVGQWDAYGPGNQLVATGQLRFDLEIVTGGAGRYLLIAAGTSATPTDYQFEVVTSAETTFALDFDSPVTAAVSEPGARDHYEFNAAAGQRLLYDARDDDMEAIFVTLFDSSDNPIAIQSARADLDSVPFTLSEAGSYRLMVDGLGDVVGDYGFRMVDVTAASAVEFGVAIADRLDVGRETDAYRLQGTAGQELLFDSTSVSSPTGTWTLYGPDNQFVRTAAIDSDFTVNLPATGEYVVVLSGSGAVAIDYEFTVSIGSPLRLAAKGPGTVGGRPPVGLSEAAARSALDFFFSHDDWLPLRTMDRPKLQVTDLPDDLLGWTTESTIFLDVTAAGQGWILPWQTSRHYLFATAADSRRNLRNSSAEGVDLMSVLEHELGHWLGLEHSLEGIMQARLAPGVRWNGHSP